MAEISYNPIPQRTPGGASIPYRSTNASGETFGAGAGRALQGFGQQLERTSDALTNYAIKEQGMVRETEATNAEIAFADQKSKILGEYRSKVGLDAYSSQEETKRAIEKAQQDIRATLKDPLTQQAFDTLTRRQVGDAFQDVNYYGSSQVKAADLNSAKAAVANSITEAGSASVAIDPARFHNALGTIDFNVRRQMQNQGWGSVMHESENGTLTFDKDEHGQAAEAVYRATLNESFGQAYENRYHALADINVVTAYAEYKKDRDNIPGTSQVALDNFFAPKVRSSESAEDADAGLLEADKDFLSLQDGQAAAGPRTDAGSALLPIISGVERSDAAARAAGVSVDEVTSPKGAVGRYQVMPLTARQYHFDPDRLKEKDYNKEVATTILNDLSSKYRNADGSVDTEAVLVAYNAGPGRANEWVQAGRDDTKLPQETQNYLNDYRKRVAPTMRTISDTATPTPGMSRADYYRTHMAEILDKTEQKARARHPDDPVYSDMARARTQQQINSIISSEEAAYRADHNLVYQAINGTLSNGAKPQTEEQLVAVSPQVKDAWHRLDQNDPDATYAIRDHVLPANGGGAGGDLKTYGPDYYKLLKRITGDHLMDPDRIKSPEQLYKYIGNGLTTAGMDKLATIMSVGLTPQGEAEKEMRKKFLEAAEAVIQPSGTGEKATVVEASQMVKFLQGFEHSYELGRKAGKTPAQLLNADSPDYLGKSIEFFAAPLQDVVANEINGGVDTEAPRQQFDTSTPEGLRAAVAAGKLNREEGIRVAREKGWVRAEPPPTGPTVPIAK